VFLAFLFSYEDRMMKLILRLFVGAIGLLALLNMVIPVSGLTEVDAQAVVDQWIEAWNARDYTSEQLNEIYAVNVMGHGMAGDSFGINSVIDGMAWAQAETPDLQYVATDHQLFGDNLIRFSYVATGTHTGTPVEGFPVTGNSISWEATVFLELNDEGKIIESWELIDSVAWIEARGYLTPRVFPYTRPNEVIDGGTIAVGDKLEGALEQGQRVRYGLTVDEDMTITIEVSSGSDDTILFVYDKNGFPMWASDNDLGEVLSTVKVKAGMTYLIEVGAWLDSGPAQYNVSVRKS
jgi:predicted ester cyclase